MSEYYWGPDWFYELCKELNIKGQQQEDLWDGLFAQSELIVNEDEHRNYLKLPLDKWHDE